MTSKNRRFVLSGGPGAGKSTVLNVLAERGFERVTETARQVIRERKAHGLPPRPGAIAFGQALVEGDIQRYRTVESDRTTFFDRGLIDALYVLEQAAGLNAERAATLVSTHPYNACVFMLPPWERIYRTDSERDQTFTEAVAVFEGLWAWYRRWGYQPVEVPVGAPRARADFILDAVRRALA